MHEMSPQKVSNHLVNQVRAPGLPDHDLGAVLAALIYLRWADFQEAEREAMAAFDDTDYDPVLPSSLHWRAWHDLPPGELVQFFKMCLLPKLRHLANTRHKPLATYLHRVSGPLETLWQVSSDGLALFVHWVAAQPFETPNDRRKLLDMFDNLLQATMDRYMGLSLTPAPLARLLVGLASPNPGDRIYDPCFGTAGLLTAACDAIISRGKDAFKQYDTPTLTIFGIEQNPWSFVIGLTRLALAGIDDPQLELGNSLERLPSDNPKRDGFDIIVANPPWGRHVETAGLDHFPVKTKDVAGLFIQHALSHLRPEGRAVILIPQGLLFRGGAERELRELLVEQHTLEAVISLPETVLMPQTAVRSSILVLRRGGATTQIRMVDAEPFFEKGKAKQPATIRDDQVQQLADALRGSKPSKNSWDVDVKFLAGFEWDFTPRRRDKNALLSILDSMRGEFEVVPLRECCQVLSGRPFPSIDQHEKPPAYDPIPYIRIKDIRRGQVAKGSCWLSPKAAKFDKNHWKLRAGDVLLPRSWNVGKVGIVRNGAVGGVPALSLFVLRTDQDRLDPHFLLAYLESSECRAWLNDRARGATIRHLSRGILEELPVPLPPLQMQQKITGQYRSYDVHRYDVLTDLSILLISTGLNDAIADWVETAVKRLPSEVEGIPESLDLEPLDRLAAEVTDLWETIAHDVFAESRLYPWLEALVQATSVLKGVRNVPRGPSLFSLLLEAARALTEVDKAIKGHLPHENHARTFNGILKNWLLKCIGTLLRDVNLILSTDTNRLRAGEMATFDVQVRNQSALPLRDVRIVTDPDWGQAEFGYLAENANAAVSLNGVGPKLIGTFTITIRWSALTLDGQRTQGTREIAFDIIEEASLVAPESTELGGSPYVCGGEIRPERDDVFFGRDELLEQIRRQVVQSGNLVLLEGNRRSGKSSILWHLAGANTVPGWLGVYCSLQGAKGSQDRVGIPTVEVFREIATSIAKSIQTLGGETPLPDGSTWPAGKKLGIAKACSERISEESPFADLRDYIEVALDALAQRNLGILLMLDEFDQLHKGIDNGITSPQVPENIRFMVQTYPRFTAILTGSPRLKHLREDYWSTLYGLGTRFDVTSLSPDAARRLVTEPVRGRLTYSKEAVERAVSVTACQPFLLQCLCNRVFDLSAQLKTRTVTLDMVDQAADLLVEDNEHFATLWGYIRSDRCRFILALCHKESKGPDLFRLRIIQEKLLNHGIEVDDETLIADLEFLRELELIKLVEGASSGHYALAIPLMGMWIDRQQDFVALQSKATNETEDQHA